MKKSIRITLISFTVLLAGFAGFVYFASWHPSDIQRERVYNLPDAPVLKSGQTIKIMTWNVQFMAGNKDNDFFFEGGPDNWPDKETLHHVIEEVARVIINENPDIVFLQELDEGAKRTYNEDQLKKLLKLLPAEFGNHVSAFYWKASFVPLPAIWGSVGMKITTISKYKIDEGIRHSLSPITNSNIIVRQFSPRRCMLEAVFSLNNGKKLHAVNTHLSAFAQGSNTMEIQISQVDELLSSLEAENIPAYIGGDFNLIPPGKTYRLLDEKGKKYFNPNGSEIEPLIEKYRMIPTVEELNGPERTKWLTNMAAYREEKIPDKTIDYFFFTSGIEVGEHYVRSEDTIPISDHLPLIAFITVP